MKAWKADTYHIADVRQYVFGLVYRYKRGSG